MSDLAKVLVIGGYGVFGARICMALARDPAIDLIVAGRDSAAATRFCAEHGGKPLALDRNAADLAAQIATQAPFLVIDAAGPFQSYGTDPYRLAGASLAAGAHYFDLSDDAAFTQGITALDTQARAANLVALSGVSSVPALSSAAVEALIPGLHDIHLIESTILPGNRAPRGLSVMRAILAQTGTPLTLWRGNRPETVPGWSDAHPVALTLPGLPPLPLRRASLIGAPDLTLFPARYHARSVVFRAGLELPIMHQGLHALSLLPRLGLLRTLAPLAPALKWLADRLHRFGTDRGGMRVRVLGQTAMGAPQCRDWTLIAGAGDGPHIPAIPARVLTARLRAGTLPPGARPCLGEFTLAEATAMMQGLDITAGISTTPMPFLFATVLGNADFAALPAPLRDLHSVLHFRRWNGRARITRGTNPAARLVATLMRFPPASSDTPVKVTMRRTGETEIWTRTFANHRFRSYLTPLPHGMSERFGPLSFTIGLAVANGQITYPVTAGRALGLPLPRWLLPHSNTTEAIDAMGRATFDVALSHPLIGLIVRYQGWLTPDDPA
ncbi:MAG: DUF4166 domain-containing protein [Paracoccaceae bacterium]